MTLAKVGAKRNALATVTSGMLSMRTPGLMLSTKDIARAVGQHIEDIRPKLTAKLRNSISNGNARVVPVWGKTATGSTRLDGLMLTTTTRALPALTANINREYHLADNHLVRAGVCSEARLALSA